MAPLAIGVQKQPVVVTFPLMGRLRNSAERRLRRHPIPFLSQTGGIYRVEFGTSRGGSRIIRCQNHNLSEGRGKKDICRRSSLCRYICRYGYGWWRVLIKIYRPRQCAVHPCASRIRTVEISLSGSPPAFHAGRDRKRVISHCLYFIIIGEILITKILPD